MAISGTAADRAVPGQPSFHRCRNNPFLDDALSGPVIELYGNRAQDHVTVHYL
jgi:hypothetical protein